MIRRLVELVAGGLRCSHSRVIMMTTHGVGLDRLASPLAAARLDRVNVALTRSTSRSS